MNENTLIKGLFTLAAGVIAVKALKEIRHHKLQKELYGGTENEQQIEE